MSEHDWIAVLARDHLALTLPVLTLVQGGIPRFQGSGQIAWDKNSGVKIRAVTDGAPELRKSFGRIGASVGKLIPLETYISATGKTQDGWDISTVAVPRQGYSVSFESPHVLWDITSDGLTLTRSLPPRVRPQRRMIRALLEPPPKHWPRRTTTEVHNEFFGGMSSQADWLQVTTRLGTLVARRQSDRAFEVRLLFETNASTDDPFEITHAVARAFGFALGRRIWIYGLEDVTVDRERRELYLYREPTDNSLRPPLGDGIVYLEHVESLLGSAVDFFLTAQGREVAEHLELCWDTADNDFTTSITVVAITLESLLRMASKSVAIGEPRYTSDDRDALLSWIEARVGLRTRRFLDRVHSFVNSLDHQRPIDVFWSFHRQGLLGVTPEDIDAWQHSRNRAAHGALAGTRPGREELQRRFDRILRVHNLINRIVLHFIGYTGSYIDYGEAGWPDTQFPPPKSNV